MTHLEAHLVCIALVAIDLLARMWRIQWFLRGLGYRITAAEAFTANAFGDAACALTPLRIGGEPARLAGMLRARVSATGAAIAILFEVLCAWPVVFIFAGTLTWLYAPEWWQTVQPSLHRYARHAWPWIIAVAIASVVAWWIGRRIARQSAAQLDHPLQRARQYWRRMAWWPLLASVPLSFLNLATRTAILPVLALTLDHPPSFGATALGSFALLYSQLVLPTPSGAGAVDLGFLGGMAGDLGGDQQWLLLAWRFYTNGVGLILGVWLAVHYYGWPALKAAIRRTVVTPK